MWYVCISDLRLANGDKQMVRKDKELNKIEGELTHEANPVDFNNAPEGFQDYLRSLDKAARKQLLRQIDEEDKAEEHKELRELAKETEQKIEALNKKLNRTGSHAYKLEDLYFKTRTITYPKAGKYKVGNEEVTWSGKGKRPAALKDKSDKELAKLKVK